MVLGQKVKMYYDPRGNVIRTQSPDKSEQWVIYGKPLALDNIDINNEWSFKNYVPTPWENYTYDANDNAKKTHPALFAINKHWNTPSNAIIDSMGRSVKSVSRLDNDVLDNELIVQSEYDILGNLVTTTNSANQNVFTHTFGIGKQVLSKKHIDSGKSFTLNNAEGKPIEAVDAKQAKVLRSYDVNKREVNVWAKDDGIQSLTLRQHSIYGDNSIVSNSVNLNLWDKVYQHYDESGLSQVVKCDFKGNPLEKFKKVISDSVLLATGTNAYTIDWTGLNITILDSYIYTTKVDYDALNRGIKISLPAAVNGLNSIVEPIFNRAGALDRIKKDGIDYVTRIAYNARGQQILMLWNNEVMMRFKMDPLTFRLKRVKAEKYTVDAGNANKYNPNSGNTRYDQQYVYDPAGNIIAVNDKTPDSGIIGNTEQLQRVFEYDALYRLVFATGRETNTQGQGFLFADAPEIGTMTASNCRYYEQEYSYDNIGNIKQLKHRVIGNTSLYYTRNFVYSSLGNHHTQVDNGQSSLVVYSTFTYDNTGNTLTSNADRNYSWNHGNLLKSFTLMSGATVNTFAQYMYDAGGARVKKFVVDANGNYESVTYIDGVFEYHKKVVGAVIAEKNYLSLLGGVEIRIGEYSGEDDPLIDTLYTINDYLSSASIRLKNDGNLYDREEYYPYGDSSLKTYGKRRYRFTGKEKDAESGLYYYGARYYCSWCCRFLSVDPKACEFANQSAYCYANDNPVVLNDPSGMQAEDPAAATNVTGDGGNTDCQGSAAQDKPAVNPCEGDIYCHQVNGVEWEYAYQNGQWNATGGYSTISEVTITPTPAFDSFTSKQYSFSPATVNAGIEDRMKDPKLINQENSNTCGPAAIGMALAKHDPQGYKDFVSDLYYNGQATYNNYSVKPDEQVLQTSAWDNMAWVQSQTAPADWVLLASIRDNENSMIDYGDEKILGWQEAAGGITFPSEVSSTLDKMGFDIKSNTFLKTANLDPTITLQYIEAQQIAGNTTIMLIDADLIGDNIGIVTYPDHYVVYAGNLTITNNVVSFDIWTWGKTYQVSAPLSEFKRGFYGGITVGK